MKHTNRDPERKHSFSGLCLLYNFTISDLLRPAGPISGCRSVPARLCRCLGRCTAAARAEQDNDDNQAKCSQLFHIITILLYALY